jgi:DNA-binding Xre family transcriptional regulator
MIKVKIKEIAEKNGVTTAYQLQKLLNIQPSLAAKWYRNDLKMIGIESLNSLCAAFKCLPSDILIYVGEAESAQISNTESSKAKESNTESSISTVHNASDSKPNKPAGASESGKGSNALPELPEGDKWLKTKDIMEQLGIKSESTVRDFYNNQGLKPTKIGMVNYVKQSDLTVFLANRMTRGKSKP